MKNLRKYIIYFIGINLIVLGIDKFLQLIPAPCTLMVDASTSALYSIGVVEIILGIMILLGKYTKTILILIILLMVWAIGMHLWIGTYDIGAAIFLALVALTPLLMKDHKL